MWTCFFVHEDLYHFDWAKYWGSETWLDVVGANAVGLHKILSLLESEDVDVRVHAVKVVANLAAEGVVPAL